MKRISLLVLVVLLGMCVVELQAGEGKVYRSLYPLIRHSFSPANGQKATLNAPTFQWPRRQDYRLGQAGNDRFDPPKTQEQEDFYQVELSQNPDFSSDVITSKVTRACFFNPYRKLANGKWYWRVNLMNDNKKVVGETQNFIIDDSVPLFVVPPIETLVANLPKKHPYMLTFGETHEKIIAAAKNNPKLVAKIIKDGEDAYKREFIDINKIQSAKEIGLSAWLGIYGRQTKALTMLAKAYLVTGDEKYLEAGKKRIEQYLSVNLPNYGMETADMSRYLAEAYDSFFEHLEPELKTRMLDRIQSYLDAQYQWWPGDKESLFLENHFWQVELSGFFFAALATIQERPENMKYLEYAYGVFLARAPVAGGNDGGWANGACYFTVNNSTVGDMAYYIYKLGKIDIYEKPWYRNLPDYYLHCTFPGAPIDGFGNMHDRAYMLLKSNKIGWNSGQVVCGYLAASNKNPKADAYLAAGNSNRQALLDLSLEELPKFDFSKFDKSQVEQAKAFKEVGVVSMHRDLFNVANDMAVYFRSSPFGNYGHAHANQNTFNISYKGERIFYPTGYYTSFSDKHSLSSYRHTKGHNAILIDGKGQAYGPEAFGYLKRYLHGENITYACGDASNAYIPVVDKMWKTLVEENFTPAEISYLHGDAELTKFDRHIAFVRPNTVIIYDELESKVPHIWSFMLQTYQEPTLLGSNELLYMLNNNTISASAKVFGSSPVKMSVSDKFDFDPQPLNPRYRNAKNQYHIATSTVNKSPKMRYLTIIQCGDNPTELNKIEELGNGKFKVGEIEISAELSTDKKAKLEINNQGNQLFVNSLPENFAKEFNSTEGSLLIEKDKKLFTPDMAPVLAH